MKRALITGGAQGIGRACVKQLLDEGYHVMVADQDAEAGQALLELYQAQGGLEFFNVDVSSEVQLKALADDLKRYDKLDALVNNAGIGISKPLKELSLEEWNKVLATNLSSIFLLTKYLQESLENASGSIVNIASTRALMSEAHTEAYSASKGAVVALSHALAISLAPKVRVNAISPGWIETAAWQKPGLAREVKHSEADRLQHPAGRVGKPEDIANMVAYLMSDKAGFITGQNFVIDGGMTKKMIYV